MSELVVVCLKVGCPAAGLAQGKWWAWQNRWAVCRVVGPGPQQNVPTRASSHPNVFDVTNPTNNAITSVTHVQLSRRC